MTSIRHIRLKLHHIYHMLLETLDPNTISDID